MVFKSVCTQQVSFFLCPSLFFYMYTCTCIYMCTCSCIMWLVLKYARNVCQYINSYIRRNSIYVLLLYWTGTPSSPAITHSHIQQSSLSLSITLRVSLFHNTFYLISINSLSFTIFPFQLQCNLSSCCYKNVSLCHYVVLLHLLRLSW